MKIHVFIVNVNQSVHGEKREKSTLLVQRMVLLTTA